jgi:predicted phosphate transport protein (TIGR00153 family)
MSFRRSLQYLFRRKADLMPIFARQAAYLCQASEILCRMLESMDSAVWRQSHKEIRALEHQGDALLTEFREQIMGRPMKPSKRANFTTVAMSMDDCLDVVKDASNAVNIYDPQKIDNQLKDLAQLILEESKALKKLLPLLSNVEKNAAEISLLCDRITEQEHEADEAYEGYIGYIFTKEENLREMTKYKNLAELFEKATDSAKHVADCVRIMILGYSEK